MQFLKLVLLYLGMAEAIGVFHAIAFRQERMGWWLSHFTKAPLLWPLLFVQILSRKARYRLELGFGAVMVWATCRFFSLLIGGPLAESLIDSWVFFPLTLMLSLLGDVIWLVLAYLGVRIIQGTRSRLFSEFSGRLLQRR